MRVEFATEPGHPGKPNEDFVVAGPTTLVLLDGVTSPADNGCKHGVNWFVERLGSALFTHSGGRPDRSLGECLHDAIEDTAALHVDACDLVRPDAPAATVVVARIIEDRLEYLVLSDSTLLIEGEDDLTVITDDRTDVIGGPLRRARDAHPVGTPAYLTAHQTYLDTLRAARNVPGGYWVAAADPAAASEALTGTLRLSDVQALAALTDGASRLVDRFGLSDWDGLMTVLRHFGPAELLARVRAAEASDADGARWPRGKTCDDATAVWALI
ncbi:protein phosphatase 2C domain-containing protein [Streptomyces sp. SID3343]|uniref:protein phosphatase 2C domain-containing protein n=1 Tax=Streptomyces sp. SID3343 TaxID=2690260 RepID=UPI00137022D9|nr:protein phosphatase 2C domain-containing protein [Streptomyces sp. SID3343]MYW02298.1 integrase [Streptomyces sp. SID3343]